MGYGMDPLQGVVSRLLRVLASASLLCAVVSGTVACATASGTARAPAAVPMVCRNEPVTAAASGADVDVALVFPKDDVRGLESIYVRLDTKSIFADVNHHRLRKPQMVTLLSAVVPKGYVELLITAHYSSIRYHPPIMGRYLLPIGAGHSLVQVVPWLVYRTPGAALDPEDIRAEFLVTLNGIEVEPIDYAPWSWSCPYPE